jgi:F-type H+-transporting ATPase subunit delta
VAELKKAVSLYSEVLFDVASEQQKTETIFTQIDFVNNSICENKEYKQLLSSPSVDKKSKKMLFCKVFNGKIDANLENFLKVLIDNNRFNLLSDIVADFKKLILEKNNIVEVTAVTAIQLDENQKTNLIKRLESKLSKTVNLICLIDEKIIGGIKIIYGNTQFDNTIKNKLENLEYNINEMIL